MKKIIMIAMAAVLFFCNIPLSVTSSAASSKSKRAAKITIGSTVNGKIKRSDSKLSDGKYYDRYKFSGSADQRVIIEMSSTKIDSYITLYKKSGTYLEYLGEDNDSGGGLNAKLVYLLPSKGTYVIFAESFVKKQVGSYTLSLAEAGIGSLSGKLSIQGYNTINEEETNDSLESAQPINSLPLEIFGDASSTDSGYAPPLSSITVQDLYVITSSYPMSIRLESDAAEADFDIYVLGPLGGIFRKSENAGSSESIEFAPIFTQIVYIGVRAKSGSGNYRLTIDYINNGTSYSLQGNMNGNIPDFVPGEAVVKYKKGKTPDVSALKTDRSFRVLLSNEGANKGAGKEAEVSLVEFDVNSVTTGTGSARTASTEDKKQLTVEMIEKLMMDDNVEYAEPNYIYHALKTPDDPYYTRQWHYNSINLPAAWDVTTGDDSIIAAVIDTGILSKHPDLQGRINDDGYDFINDVSNSLDGDGIDSNPEDPGDDPNHNNSSYHGSHVAGTIGAATDNSTGVAGVTWSGKIMPLRVLGATGGTNYDISQAIRYAAGLSNVTGTKPAKKADVMNMSLGGGGYSKTMADAVKAAINAGVTVVAAAGNDSSSSPSYPAAYDGVISVGAVDYALKLSYYSNFGNTTIVAPGGDTNADKNNDGYSDGVLSTLKFDSTGQSGYEYYQGTSMASPHVAGVVSLMQAARIQNGFAKLSPSSVTQILKDTAIDLGASGNDSKYGYGLVNAEAAVKKAIEISGSGDPVLSASVEKINFGIGTDEVQFTLSNSGGGTLNITSINSTETWLTVTPTISTTISAGESALFMADVDRTGLSDGSYSAAINIESDGGSSVISVTMQIGEVTARDAGKIFVLVVNSVSYDTEGEAEADFAGNYEYVMTDVPEGDYFVVAGTDRNNDGYICDEGDACGYYPTTNQPSLVTINADTETSGIDFSVEEQTSLTSQQIGRKGYKLLHK